MTCELSARNAHSPERRPSPPCTLPTRFGVAATLRGMTSQRQELERLVRELPEEEVPHVLDDVRTHLRSPRGQQWPPAWFGAAAGRRTDTSERVDELLSDGFGK